MLSYLEEYFGEMNAKSNKEYILNDFTICPTLMWWCSVAKYYFSTHFWCWKSIAIGRRNETLPKLVC